MICRLPSIPDTLEVSPEVMLEFSPTCIQTLRGKGQRYVVVWMMIMKDDGDDGDNDGDDDDDDDDDDDCRWRSYWSNTVLQCTCSAGRREGRERYKRQR
ncbi:hypothetical protein PoB_002966200 [Plakobranchus ocellatus]|uniref:Uncharacterized protein n=1 Tax=Plakobranchus ocellatus TaxID=259542 RepID=A0AAV4A7A1_9GAST|nr:hypothetical protein PoB_002966200 [Plakobranchus ocellatus]